MINGIPLLAVVIGLVEWVKRFGLEGKTLNLVSLVIGLVIGLAYQYSLMGEPSFSGWFSAAIYGLALGLIASGVYDAARSVTRGEP
jgi:hypothetical protein